MSNLNQLKNKNRKLNTENLFLVSAVILEGAVDTKVECAHGKKSYITNDSRSKHGNNIAPASLLF